MNYRPHIVLLLSILVLGHRCFTQGERKFIGRLVMLDGSQKALNNLPVRIVDQGQGVTGTDGKFEIAIKGDVREVTVELVSSDWKIIYPTGGKALVPVDENKSTEFIVGDSPKDVLTKAVAKSNNEIKERLSKLGVKQDAIEQTLTAFRNEIQQMSDIKLSDLRDQIDLDAKRTEFYPVLASAINDYINEAKDIKDAFKFTSQHAFDDNQALQVLVGAVESYNVAFEEINKKHAGYEKTVLDLWQSEAKAGEVRELFNYALGELHSANIFTLNLKIKDINDYNRGHYKGSKKAFKETITREIETTELQLERRLDELNKRAQVVLSKLAA